VPRNARHRQTAPEQLLLPWPDTAPAAPVVVRPRAPERRKRVIDPTRPSPYDEQLAPILLERAGAMASTAIHRGADWADADELAAEIIARALPRARKWRPGRKPLNDFVGGACYFACRDILRERRSSIQFAATGKHIRGCRMRNPDPLDLPGRKRLESVDGPQAPKDEE
jgi:hypothetical protein